MRALLFAAALATTIAGHASAETMQFKGTLSAKSEVPPHADLSGAGTVAATFDPASMQLTYTVTYQGLTGPAVAAHFHGPAGPGENAGVLVPVSGTLTSPISGSATLTADQAKVLESGKLYFNVHTAANKGGEIRGQVEKGM